jgi:phenylacetate-CoA ligase
MIQIPNPIFFSKAFHRYLVDPSRLRKMNDETLKRFQDKSLQTILSYAYEVPVYREKYKKAGIRLCDIHGIKDLHKLPCITKEDLRGNFPDNVVVPSFQKKSGIIASTSATTGAPLSLYFTLLTVLQSMLGFVRILREHEINWKRTKIALLLDLSVNSFENGYFLTSVFPSIKPLISLKNMQVFDIRSPPSELIEKLNVFQPEVIIGYPFVLIQLAYLKENGYGRNITPRVIGSSGAYFDRYSRHRVEEAFGAKTFDIYAATESGPMAFECREKRYHILSDLVHLEIIDTDGGESTGKTGTIVVTKLYGQGTPIIRYTGIDDVITPARTPCSCGLAGDLIESIHGRRSDAFLLPNGKLVCISFFDTVIGAVLSEMKMIRVKRMQLIQQTLNKVEIKIALDDNVKKTDPLTDELFSRIQANLLKRLGSDVDLMITQVDGFDSKAPYVISNLGRKSWEAREYIL